jgi:hypothetical protein
MKSKKLIAAIPMLVAAAAMTACGGGGDAEAGSPTAFSIVPSTVTFTAPPAGTSVGTCPAGGTATIFVYGGAAPYRLDNTVPNFIALSAGSVSDRGGSFTITTLGGCVSPGNIVVVDKLGNNVTLTITTTPGA